MPQFAPSIEKVAVAPLVVKPSGLSCNAELSLISGSAKVATSVTPFISTGAQQQVRLPITMPGVEGTYPVYLDIDAEGVPFAAFVATEDIVISPVTANLLLNPGFESDLEHWVRYSNYSGRARWDAATSNPYTGLKSAVFVGSIAGRSVVATLSQVIPWQNEYRGQTFKLSAMRGSYPSGTGHNIEGTLTFIINDGVSVTEVAAYVSHRSAYREQSVTKTLSPSASKLEVTFEIVPHRDFHGGRLCVDDCVLEQV